MKTSRFGLVALVLLLAATVAYASDTELLKKAEGGDPAAMAALADAISEEKPEEARTWYFKAADMGYAPAELTAFEILFEESSLEPAQHQRQYAYLLRAADKGYAPAQHRLGNFLSDLHPMNGGFAEADPAAAAIWIRKAAEQNHVDALFDWGLVQAAGEGVPRDVQGGLRAITAAAEAGKAEAWLYLADLYATGEDDLANKVPVNLPEAIRWRRKLVESGEENAVVSLAEHLVRQPDATDEHRAEARQLLERQAAAGIVDAIEALAKLDRPRPADVAATASAALGSAASTVVVVAPATPVAPVTTTVPSADLQSASLERAQQELEARYQEFDREFASALDRAGREKAIRDLDAWILSTRFSAQERTAAGKWVFGQMVDRLRQHRGEAIHLVMAFSNFTVPPEAVRDLLPADLTAVVREGAQRIGQDFAKEQRIRGKVSANWDAAHAGDGQAQLALGLAYLEFPRGAEENWAHAVHWLTQAHNQKIPGAFEPLKKLSDDVNARMKSAAAAKDMPALLGIHRQKAGSPLPDAHLSAHTIGAILLEQGYGRAEDIPEAKKYLQQAADKGHVDSLLELGQLYVLHEGQPIDEVQALAWFEKAAAAGSKKAEAWVQVLTPNLDRVERGKLAQKIAGEQMQRSENKFDFSPAVPFSAFAARLGNPQAMAFTASQYVESDPEKALELYHAAAEAGSASAMSFLATSYARGDGGDKDPAKARAWRLKAGAAGGMWEKNAAGLELMNGINGPIDFAGARTWFLEAGQLGQFESLYHLGEMWFDGKMEAGSDEEAVRWWTKAAENGIEEAQYRLGLLYRDGRGGVKKDLVTARRWVGDAAFLGYEPAKVALKELEGSPATAVAREANEVVSAPDKTGPAHSADVTSSPAASSANQSADSADGAWANARMFAGMGLQEDAQKMLLRAVSIAETGSPAVKHQLATMLFQGTLAVGKDPGRAAKLLAAAADAGHVPAQVDYGHVLTQGAFGLPADTVQAEKYFRMAIAAADTGSDDAKLVVSSVLYQGAHGIPADRPRAVRLLKEAAVGGQVLAQMQYATVLFAGTPEIPRDPAAGFEFLKKAAEHQLPQAMLMLGQAYESGTGTAVDLAEARRWYGLAATANVPGAEEANKRLQDAASSMIR